MSATQQAITSAEEQENIAPSQVRYSRTPNHLSFINSNEPSQLSFPDLPTEIRLKIWSEVEIEPRIIEVSVASEDVTSKSPKDETVAYSITANATPSPLLGVCRESRILALEVVSAKLKSRDLPAFYRFNPFLDTIVFTHYKNQDYQPHHDTQKILSGVHLSSDSLTNIRHMAVDSFECIALVGREMGIFRFTALETLTVLVHDSSCGAGTDFGSTIRFENIRPDVELNLMKVHMKSGTEVRFRQLKEMNAAWVPPKLHVKALLRNERLCCEDGKRERQKALIARLDALRPSS